MTGWQGDGEQGRGGARIRAVTTMGMGMGAMSAARA